MKQATADPVPVRRLRSDVPPPLSDLIDRLLAKDPAERFQTAEEVSRALVAAVPTAVRDSVRVRRGALSIAIQTLVGLGVAGSLAFVAFVAGAAVVAFAVFSKAPRLSASAPIPDSVSQRLRRQGALAGGGGDAAQYVFAPGSGGGEDTTVLLVTRRSVAVVTPHRVRAYPRDSVRVGYGVEVRRGLAFRLVLTAPRARRDTAFRNLSFRDLYALMPRLGKLLGEDSGRVRARLRP